MSLASLNEEDLRKLPHDEVQRVVAVVKLGDQPFPYGSQKLAGTEHTYRIRLGDYRVIYTVSSKDKVLEVQRVRHRKDVYR